MMQFIDLPYPQIKASNRQELEAQINDYMYKVIEAIQFALAEQGEATESVKAAIGTVGYDGILQAARSYALQVAASAEGRAKAYADELFEGGGGGSCSLSISKDLDTGIVTFTCGEGGGGSGYPTYTGQTTVIPEAFTEQVLATAQKSMESNITVTEVPYSETSNTSGLTAYIASDVNEG